MEGKANINQTFYTWWYREEAASLFAFLKYFYKYLADLFSVKICLRTLLYPWKRDQLDYAGLSLKDKFQVLLLNMVSRLFGAFIKLFTLAAYLVAALIWTFLAALICLLWLLFPLCLVAIAGYGISLLIR